MAIVNVGKDDMRRTIAKMGGITLDGGGHQAGALWGNMARDAHTDRRFNFVPGCGLLFKRVAGLPVDRIVSSLVELEYLRTDDLTEFESKLQQVIAGARIWSAQKSDYSHDKIIEYGDYPEYDLITDEDEPEEVRERTPEEIDAFGDIIAFLMGDIDELVTDSDDTGKSAESAQITRNAIDSLIYGKTAGQVTNSHTGHELRSKGHDIETLFADLPYKSCVPNDSYGGRIRSGVRKMETAKQLANFNEFEQIHFKLQGERMKQTRTEHIRKRLEKLPPESRNTVKRLLIETLENAERRTGTDMGAEKQAVSDA